jgi:acetyl-CoA acyltransferase
MGLTAEALHNNLKFLEKIKMSLFTTHMKALKAQADGKFDKIVPISVDQTFNINEKENEVYVVNKDEGLELELQEALAGLSFLKLVWKLKQW